MVTEDQKIVSTALRKPRASKIPTRLFNSPKSRLTIRHIKSDLISSTPLDAKKRNVQGDQLSISPIKNPSSGTVNSSPANLNGVNVVADKEMQVKEITETIAKKSLSTISTKSVNSFYPFPLSRVRRLQMVLCDSDDFIFRHNKSDKKIDKNEKLDNKLLNTENENEDIFNSDNKSTEVITEIKVSHNNKSTKSKEIVTINKTAEKRILRSFRKNSYKTVELTENTNSNRKTEVEFCPKNRISASTESKQKGRAKNKNSVVEKSKTNEKKGSNAAISNKTIITDHATTLQSTGNETRSRPKSKNSKMKITNNNEMSSRKSARRRMSCAKYWLNNNKNNKLDESKKQISNFKHPAIKKSIVKNLSYSEPNSKSVKNDENNKKELDNVIPEKLSTMIPVIKRLSSPAVSKQDIVNGFSNKNEEYVVENTILRNALSGSKYSNKYVSQEKENLTAKDKSLTSNNRQSNCIVTENEKFETPEKMENIHIVEMGQQCKTPEQNNVINQLITLSTRKSSVRLTGKKTKFAGKLRRSLAFKNKSLVKKYIKSEDDSYTTEEENGIPSDTLLVRGEPVQENEILHETRKRKTTKNGDTFDTKKIKLSNTKYSFKDLAIEADITPVKAGGLADVQINGKRCLLGCFGKFPRQYNMNINNPDISVGISLNNPYIATGIIELTSNGKKKYEYAKKADLLFVVLEGMAEVGIGNSSQVLRMGQDFFVPRDTPYYIFNLSTTDKLLLYFSKFIDK